MKWVNGLVCIDNLLALQKQLKKISEIQLYVRMYINMLNIIMCENKIMIRDCTCTSVGQINIIDQKNCPFSLCIQR